MRKIILLSSAILMSVGVGFGQGIELTPSGYTGTQNSINDDSPTIKMRHPSLTGFNRISFENEGRDKLFVVSSRVLSTDATSTWHVYYKDLGNILTATGEGRVGIGTSGPQDKLHVSGGDLTVEDATPFISLKNSGGTGAAGLRFSNSFNQTRALLNYSEADDVVHLVNGSSSSEGLWLDDDNNMGLNEDEPEAKLHIRANSTPTIPHLRFYENNNASADNITFENFNVAEKWLIKAQANDTPINANFVIKTTGEDVVTYTGDGNTEHHGFTHLGDESDDDAPAIKMKKITGTTVNGSTTSITHGLTASKILDVSILVRSNSASERYYPPSGNGLAVAGLQYRFRISSGTIILYDVGVNLRSQSYKVLVTYEE